jgi:hypothetical protein
VCVWGGGGGYIFRPLCRSENAKGCQICELIYERLNADIRGACSWKLDGNCKFL